jgi:hypothetical protein
VRQLEQDLIAAFEITMPERSTASWPTILSSPTRSARQLRKPWLEDLASGVFAFESVEIEGMQVRMAGDAALVTGSRHFKSALAGGRLQRPVRCG